MCSTFDPPCGLVHVHELSAILHRPLPCHAMPCEMLSVVFGTLGALPGPRHVVISLYSQILWNVRTDPFGSQPPEMAFAHLFRFTPTNHTLKENKMGTFCWKAQKRLGSASRPYITYILRSTCVYGAGAVVICENLCYSLRHGLRCQWTASDVKRHGGGLVGDDSSDANYRMEMLLMVERRVQAAL